MTAIPTQWSHNNITVCHLFRQSSQKSKPLFKTSTENPAQPVCPSKYGVNLITLLAATMLIILAMKNWQNPVPVQKLCPNSEVIPMALYLGMFVCLFDMGLRSSLAFSNGGSSIPQLKSVISDFSSTWKILFETKQFRRGFMPPQLKTKQTKQCLVSLTLIIHNFATRTICVNLFVL